MIDNNRLYKMTINVEGYSSSNLYFCNIYIWHNFSSAIEVCFYTIEFIMKNIY